MKAYKGFNADMTCRGFQFEEGKTYEENEAKLCESGFHACENPLDCFEYYKPGSSVYHEVELEATEETNADDSKRCGKKITIGARLDIAGLCKAHFEYVKERCGETGGHIAGYSGSAAAGDVGNAAAGDGGSAAAGYRGSASAGDGGSAAAGDGGNAAAGDRGSAAAGDVGNAAAGDRGSAAAGYSGSAAAGNFGSAAAGDRGSAAAGYSGSAAAGYRGSASAGYSGCASAGYKGSAAAGENGIACCRGGKVKGSIGAVLAVSELDDLGNNIAAKAVIVDGVNVKADTWYTLKNGELVEENDDVLA